MFALMVVAGNETTRQAIALSTLALAQPPERYRRLREEPRAAALRRRGAAAVLPAGLVLPPHGDDGVRDPRRRDRGRRQGHGLVRGGQPRPRPLPGPAPARPRAQPHRPPRRSGAAARTSASASTSRGSSCASTSRSCVERVASVRARRGRAAAAALELLERPQAPAGRGHARHERRRDARAEVEGVSVPTDHFIDGRRVGGAERFEVRSPIDWDGWKLADVAAGGAAEVDAAVAAARRAFPAGRRSARTGVTSI